MKHRSRNGGRLGLCSILLLTYLSLPELRVEAFVIVNLKQQALQTRPMENSNMKRINTELERRHPHTSIVCRMASVDPESEDEIDALYRIVAEQDPEWFQDFVTNVLGEESVDKELLALSRTTSASREKTVVEAVPKKDIPPSDEELVYEQIPPEIKEDEPVVAAASATVTEEDVPIVNDVKFQDENEEHEEEDISVEEATDVGREVSLDEEVVIVSESDTDEDLDETIPLSVLAKDEVEVVAVSSSDTDEDLNETEPLPVAKEEAEVVASNETFSQNNESTLPDDDKAEASSEEEASSDRIILYRDAYSQSFVQVDLANVLSLGYLEFEICMLEADTLDLIASDGIVKPRSGVPSRWKIKSGQPAQVRILSKVQADQVVSDEIGKKKEGRRNRIIDMVESSPAETDTLEDELDPVVPTRESPKKERVPISKEDGSRREADRIRPPRSKAAAESAPGERPPSTARKSQARGERDESFRERDESPRERSPSSRRERSSKRSDRDESQRRMYDGRPSPSPSKSKRKRDDPPSPNSPVWVDIDTFRDLLRSEAGLRLRILGDDWADTVKEESNWRLDLYKEWLWTLHNGVGKPIVESRSDRMRRKRGGGGGGKREEDKRDPPARRPRKRRER
jgi:hypothetical protein